MRLTGGVEGLKLAGGVEGLKLAKLALTGLRMDIFDEISKCCATLRLPPARAAKMGLFIHESMDEEESLLSDMMVENFLLIEAKEILGEKTN